MKTHFFMFLIVVLFFSSCKNTPSKYIYNEGFIYGTIYHIVYESPQGEDFQDEITRKAE